MRIKKTAGAMVLGLMMLVAMPAVTEAGHRHHGRCGHRVGKVYSYDYRPYHYGGYYSDRYYDRYDSVDYDAPYVARHGSGRRYYDDYDYGYRGYSRPHTRTYYSPRHGSRRVGYHYHGRTRCYRPDRPHIHFSLRLF